MEPSRLIRSRWVIPLLLLLLLVAAVAAIAVHWPKKEGEAAKVQAVAGLIGLAATLVIAFFTWLYVRITHQMLEVQQTALEFQQPKVNIHLVWASLRYGGVSPEDGRKQLHFSARVEFQNMSWSTPTTVKIMQGELADPPANFHGAHFEERVATGQNRNTHPLAQGEVTGTTVSLLFSLSPDIEIPRGTWAGSLVFWDPLNHERRLPFVSTIRN